jgi:hypothetical protein
MSNRSRSSDIDARKSRLLDTIQEAESLLAFGRSPEVQRWLSSEVDLAVDAFAAATDDHARVMAAARAKVLRDLRAHISGVESAANQARQRLDSLEATTNG